VGNKVVRKRTIHIYRK